MLIKLVMFDLDDTLTESKCAVKPDMVEVLHELLATRSVAIISGCKWEQFQRQLVQHIDAVHYPRLVVAPVSGGQVFRWFDDRWQLRRETSLGISLAQVREAFEKAFAVCGYQRPARLWGAQFEDRGCQVTFSALGQEAPYSAKKTFDPDFRVRKPLIRELERILPPHLLVRAGGATSIDVSAFEKDYGIGQVVREMEAEGIDENDVLFVGDAIFPGGNDYCVTRTKVRYVATKGLEDTQRIIRQLMLAEPELLAASAQGTPGTPGAPADRA